MPKYNTVAAAVIIAALSAASGGCATTRPIASGGAIATPPHAFGKVEVGDRVSVEMADGSRHHFRVRSVGPNALISDVGGTYPWNDLKKVRRHSADVEQKRWLVAGAMAGFVVFMKVLESIDFFGT
jgi:hypothetical protein